MNLWSNLLTPNLVPPMNSAVDDLSNDAADACCPAKPLCHLYMWPGYVYGAPVLESAQINRYSAP